MLSNSKPIIKEQIHHYGVLEHCSQNTTEIHGYLHCWKCREDRKGKVKRFDNCRSLFYHYMKHHSGDKESYPRLEDCISQLQVISDTITLGILR